ncbi:MAG: hypothetical protein R3B82_18665 [Sandaracinaceae bacterium]
MLVLVGCGGAATPEAREPAAEASVTTPAPTAPPRSEGTIARAELDQVLAGGIGRFLQRFETEPHLDDGRFVGFRFTAIHSELFQGVDLQPGDTILSVNGMRIERPEEALQVWNALRVASELTVEFLREGERHQLRFAIAE